MLSFQLCPTLCDPVDSSLPGSSVHGDSLGKNTEVGYHFLLQENLPDPCLLHWQVDSLPLIHLESPEKLAEN